MYSYIGMECPVCGSHFTEDDDVVVCPVCGAPHHRSCYNEIGHCKFMEDHGTERQWERPEQPQEPNSANKGEADREGNPGGTVTDEENAQSDQPHEIECPRCKTKNNSSMNFCTKCGYPINPDINPNAYTPNGQPFNQPGAAIIFDPYGGVDPKSKIDGAPVADIAAFVGQNSGYYIPRFKEMSEGKRKNFLNFGSLIFGHIWYGFRKMPLYALIIAVFDLILTTFYSIVSVTPDMAASFQQTYGLSINSYTFPPYVIYVLWLLILAMRIVLLICSNRIYMKYVINKVKALSEKYQSIDELEYQRALTSRGGISFAIAAVIMAVTYFLSSGLLMYFLM